MAVCIVNLLKKVNIHDCHGICAFQIGLETLKIQSRVRSGQGIAVEVHKRRTRWRIVVAAAACALRFVFMRSNLQCAGTSVDVDMFRKHEVHLPVTHFKLGDPLFSFQRAGRNTIFAWLASAPNFIAAHRRSDDFAAFIQLKDLVRFRINKAHHFKHTAQVIQEMRYVVFRALFERIFSAPYHFILNIFKVSEHAGIVLKPCRPK